ncbi:hypothetical protein Tco_0632936, partial [Tanacetum coccineum]
MYYPRFTKAIIHHFLSKDKSISMRNKMFMHTAQDDSILGTLRFVSIDEDTQVYGALILAVMTTPKIRDSPAYQTYLAFATRAATPKPKRIYKKHDSPMIKTTTTSPEETPSKRKSTPAKKDVSSKKPSRKKSSGVQIKDTPGVSVSKKKAPAITDKSKGMLLSEAALLKDAQMKKVIKRSKRETHSLQASGSGDGVGSQPKVPDEPKGKTTSTNEGNCGDDDDVRDDDGNEDDSDDDGGDNDSESEKTESDKDENPNLNQNDDDIEEEYEDEYVHGEHGEEGKGDAELTDAGHDNVTQEKIYDQDEDDAHVTLTAVHDTQKTEVPLQSSYVSSDFATQFLNLDNVPPADTEINSIMNINVPHEELSNQTPSLLTIPVTVIPETSIETATTISPPIPPFTPLPHQSTPTPTPTIEATTSLPVIPDFSSLFGFDQRVSILEKELSQLKQVD